MPYILDERTEEDSVLRRYSRGDRV